MGPFFLCSSLTEQICRTVGGSLGDTQLLWGSVWGCRKWGLGAVSCQGNFLSVAKKLSQVHLRKAAAGRGTVGVSGGGRRAPSVLGTPSHVASQLEDMGLRGGLVKGGSQGMWLLSCGWTRILPSNDEY